MSGYLEVVRVLGGLVEGVRRDGRLELYLDIVVRILQVRMFFYFSSGHQNIGESLRDFLQEIFGFVFC